MSEPIKSPTDGFDFLLISQHFMKLAGFAFSTERPAPARQMPLERSDDSMNVNCSSIKATLDNKQENQQKDVSLFHSIYWAGIKRRGSGALLIWEE